jgi:hypothetical protein
MISIGVLLLACAVLSQEQTPALGWFLAGSQPRSYRAVVDLTTAQTGRASAKLAVREQLHAHDFGTLMQRIRADRYRGKRVRLSAYVRTEGVDHARIWMRVDGPDRPLAFDNRENMKLTGDNGWTMQQIVLDVPHEAVSISYGFMIGSRGQAWADDFFLQDVETTAATTGIAGAGTSLVDQIMRFAQTVLISVPFLPPWVSPTGEEARSWRQKQYYSLCSSELQNGAFEQ